MRRFMRSLIAVSLVILLSKPMYAWNSYSYNGHERLTHDAVGQIDANDYPDLYRFETQLRNGSTAEGSHDTDGYGQFWAGAPSAWDNSISNNYASGGYGSAYTYIGYKLHLWQDGYVPAHQKYNVHGYFWRWTDELESWATNGTNFGYNGPVPEAQWTFSEGGRTWHYWLSDSEDDDIAPWDVAEADTTTDDGPAIYRVNRTTWGSYGHGTTVDVIPGLDQGEDFFSDQPNADIGRGQLYLARIETEEIMRAESEKLPPVLSSITIANNFIVSPVHDGTIGLNGLAENRKAAVTVYLQADCSIWSCNLNVPADQDSSQLPFHTAQYAIYDYHPTNLQTGVHTLVAKVVDSDNNCSVERTGTLVYDCTEPAIVCSAPTFEVSIPPDDPNMANSTTITCSIEDPWPAQLENYTYTVTEIYIKVSTSASLSDVVQEWGPFYVNLAWNGGKGAYCGTKTVEWDGTKAESGKISPGIYYIYARAKDPAGNTGENLGTGEVIMNTAAADPSFIQVDLRAPGMVEYLRNRSAD